MAAMYLRAVTLRVAPHRVVLPAERPCPVYGAAQDGKSMSNGERQHTEQLLAEYEGGSMQMCDADPGMLPVVRPAACIRRVPHNLDADRPPCVASFPR